MLQLPEPADESSNAAKTGFRTIAEIGTERIRRVIKKVRENSEGKLDLEQKAGADLGFKVMNLDRFDLAVRTQRT